MLNYLGKTLVFVHFALSVTALTWAGGLFLQFTDFGWKEPKQDLDVRIASEFDKSAAAVKIAVRARDIALPLIKPAQDSLAQAERIYPQNHLYYVRELEKLRGEPLPGKAGTIEAKDTIDVTEFKGLDGPLWLGKPVPGAKIEGLDKSLLKYRKIYEDRKEEIAAEEVAIQKVLADTTKITQNLTGKNEAGMRVMLGIYDLVDAEYLALTEARKEREELKPIWAQRLEEARLYTERRSVLENTLSRLQRALKR
jgi:hypothetical protein